jgi:integrase
MKRTNRRGRPVTEIDRKRILKQLSLEAAGGTVNGLRNRALVLLAWDSALRVAEVTALNLAQVVIMSVTGRSFRIRSEGWLQKEQSKGNEAEGIFLITESTRKALTLYVRALKRERWIKLPPGNGLPLFLTVKLRGGAGHKRLSIRGAQNVFLSLQERARITEPYRFHDLRHDAITRFAETCDGNAFRVAEYMRVRDIRTAIRYVHGSLKTSRDIAERASVTIQSADRR